MVDFGDLQVFEGVTIYPAIVTCKRGGGDGAGDLAYLKLGADLPEDLGRTFAVKAGTMPRARLGAGSWRLEDDDLAALREKIAQGRKTLGEVYGPPLYGIKTGLNKAFVIDRATRDRLVAADPKSVEILKPFLRGENIKRWRVESEDLWLINTPKGKVDIDLYPAIRDWLLPFKPALEKRATKQAWFELQQAQLAYQERMKSTKIFWPHFQQRAEFVQETDLHLLNNKCFFIPSSDRNLLGLLNSSVSWFELSSIARPKRGGYIEAEAQYVEKLSIPGNLGRTGIDTQCTRCEAAARAIQTLAASFCHRLLDLATGTRRSLTGKLETFWTLDFPAFRAEVKKAFGADIPVKERADWEAYLAESSAKVKALSAEIEAAEREIDAIVYGLFDLTPDEIALIEREVR